MACERTPHCISFLSSEIRTVLHFGRKNLPCYQIDISHRNDDYPLFQITREQISVKTKFVLLLFFVVFFKKYAKFNAYFAYLYVLTLHDNCRSH